MIFLRTPITVYIVSIFVCLDASPPQYVISSSSMGTLPLIWCARTPMRSASGTYASVSGSSFPRGALIALAMTPSFRYFTTFSATSVETLSCASTVLAPRWGVVTRLSSSRSFCSAWHIGSSHHTSNAAPAILLVLRAW